MSIKVEFVNICRGCLSSDRNVKPLKNNASLFFFLLADDFIAKDSGYFNMNLCWECVALLQKVADFQAKIQRSRDIYLEEVKADNFQSLSKLSVYHKNYYDEINVEEELETEEYDVKVEIEDSSNAVKTEINDNDCDKNILNKDYTVSVKEPTEDLNDKTIKDEDDFLYLEEDSFDNNEETTEDIPKSVKKTKRSTSEKKKQSFKTSRSTIKVEYNEVNSDSCVTRVEMSVKEIEGLPKSKRGFVHMSYRANRAVKKMLTNKINNLKRCPVSKTCRECEAVLLNRTDMIQHWNDHKIPLFKCNHCRYYCLDKEEVINHLQQRHPNIFVCKCGAQFRNMRDYSKHNKELHSRYHCDICKKIFRAKNSIEKHILRRHLPAKCHQCRKIYKNHHILHTHRQIFHPGKMKHSEKPYCVECDMRFESEYLYRRHLRSAVAHVPRLEVKVPCPECGKVFARKTYMTNHYKLVHVRQSKHHCEICDKYYVTGYALRTHKKFVHDKLEKPKDKICDICGRGFYTNRVLNNHRRTHTGERPFACSYCPAAFGQRSAMKTHERTQHKNFTAVITN